MRNYEKHQSKNQEPFHFFIIDLYKLYIIFEFLKFIIELKCKKNIYTGGTVSAKKLYPKKFCTKCTFCAKCTLPKKSFSKNNQIV